MIRQYLPNNNETATVAFRQNFCQLNSPYVHVLAAGYGCVQFLKKKVLCEKIFSVTSNLRYMHGVLNVDKIKN
jgi:hypothetical protein